MICPVADAVRVNRSRRLVEEIRFWLAALVGVVLVGAVLLFIYMVVAVWVISRTPAD